MLQVSIGVSHAVLLTSLQRLRHAVQCSESLCCFREALYQKQAWDDDPDEVHEDKVEPVVESFRARIDDTLVIFLKQAGRIVEDISVYLSGCHQRLQWVSIGILGRHEVGSQKGQWSPANLSFDQRCHFTHEYAHTAVMVSMQSTNGSDQRYLQEIC